MTLEFIPLGQLKVYSNWAAAPVGRIIQIAIRKAGGGMPDASPMIAMRCELTDGALCHLPWVVGLEGDDAGIVFTTEQLGIGPAIDVTSLVVIGVGNALAVSRDLDAYPAGRVLLGAKESFVLKAEVARGVHAYIQLSAPGMGTQVDKPLPPGHSIGGVAVRWPAPYKDE